MNQEQLFNSFSYLDESLLERSETKKPHASWRKWAGAAACLALAVALTVPALMRDADKRELSGEIFKPEAASSAAQFAPGYEPKPGEKDTMATEVANAPMIALPDSSSTIKPPFLMISSYGDNDKQQACYVTPKNGETNRSIPLRGAMDQYGDRANYRVVVDLFQNERQLAPDGAEAAAEMERLAGLGYTVAYETYRQDTISEQSWFTLHATYDQLASFPASADYGYMLFLYAERVPDYESREAVVFNGSMAVESGALAVCPPDTSDALTFDEARADADFGAYLCDAPAGFAEQEFHRSPTLLRAWFCRGLDYVEWYVRSYTELDAPCLTSIADTENYDLALYPIPRADSVPAEKREIVDHPIFRADELTLETVYKRAYQVSEAGDTDGWRISFCVLYGDTLVQINTKGVSPEWVYEQLMALR